MPPAPRNAKHWAFTSFDIDNFERFWKENEVAFVIIGKEVCPDTHREHLQGYLCLTKKRRLTWLKNHIDDAAHWEECKGTPQENIEYCSKEGNVVLRRGKEPVCKGKRTDLDAVRDMLLEGAAEWDIANAHFAPWLKYRHSFNAFRLIAPGHTLRTPEIHILIGASGTRKSYAAFTHAPDAYWLPKPAGRASTLWWDGYTGQSTVVIDEFYGWIAYDALLRLLDYYPLHVQCKGGSVPLRAHRWVFTSNAAPADWYPGVRDTSALDRRIREFGFLYNYDNGDSFTGFLPVFGPAPGPNFVAVRGEQLNAGDGDRDRDAD